jgi:hypothetical protein
MHVDGDTASVGCPSFIQTNADEEKFGAAAGGSGCGEFERR